MCSFSASDVLTLVEAGHGHSPVERALMLLHADCADQSVEDLAALSIGARDARLLAMRERVFGSTIASLSTCPECGAHLEQAFSVEDILPPRTEEGAPMLSVDVDGEVVQFRLPNSRDLAALSMVNDPEAARGRLVERCVLTTLPPSEHRAVARSEAVIQRIADAMAQADPRGDIQLALTCPACSLEWAETFDIVSFFWSELSAWSSRVVDAVHRLASAYGWHEADI